RCAVVQVVTPPFASRAPLGWTAPKRVRGGPATSVVGQSAGLVGQIARVGVQDLRLDAARHRELDPGGHHARGDLEIHVVVGDALDGAVQARRGLHAITDLQRLLQVDGGLHRALLSARREVHERTQDDQHRQEDNRLVHEGKSLSSTSMDGHQCAIRPSACLIIGQWSSLTHCAQPEPFANSPIGPSTTGCWPGCSTPHASPPAAATPRPGEWWWSRMPRTVAGCGIATCRVPGNTWPWRPPAYGHGHRPTTARPKPARWPPKM